MIQGEPRSPIFKSITNVQRNDRICNVCNSGEVGDEFHYLFNCSFFTQLRKTLIPERYRKNTNFLSFESVMNENNEQTLCKLGKFVSVIMNHFKYPPKYVNLSNC